MHLRAFSKPQDSDQCPLMIVDQPRLSRTAPCASSGPTPMAASTWDGWTLPEEQAEPEETAIPSEIEADHRGFRPHAGNREQGGVGQARDLARRTR